MNPLNHNVFAKDKGSGEAEETLRVIANLPAPEGLEERVKAGLRGASRNVRVLQWPVFRENRNGWMHETARAAAAAAIVFVVVGGGWGVYSRVQPPPAQAKVMVMPQRVNGAGGFSSAGAMRTPQTLNGPVLAHPVTVTPKQNKVDEKARLSAQKPRRTKTTRHVQPPTQSTP